MPDAPSLHTFEVPRTARAATLGPPTANEWWVVLHGYGQLAADFIDGFRSVVTSNRCVVAPEGLSRFYVDGMDAHEQVGASWMTREARDDDIRDYVRALDTAVRHLRPTTEGPDAITALGFSQGAATASRWVLLGDTVVDRLVLWGGAPAHDLDLSVHADALRRLSLTLVLGTNDPHVPPERRATVRDRLGAANIPVTVHTFDGGHHLDADTLRALAAESSPRGPGDPDR